MAWPKPGVLKYFPVSGAVWRENAPAAKVMLLPSQRIPGPAGSCIEVGGVWLCIGVDRHQYPLPVQGPLEDQLLILQQEIPITAVAKRLTLLMGGGACGNPFGQLRPDRLLQARPQGVVPVGLLPGYPPLAAVLDAGDTRHGKQQRID